MRQYRISSTAALVAGATIVFALGVATGNGFHRADARPSPVQQEEVGRHQVAKRIQPQQRIGPQQKSNLKPMSKTDKRIVGIEASVKRIEAAVQKGKAQHKRISNKVVFLGREIVSLCAGLWHHMAKIPKGLSVGCGYGRAYIWK